MASEKNGEDQLLACLKMRGQLGPRQDVHLPTSFPSAEVKKNGKRTQWRKTFDVVIFVMMTSLISSSSKCLRVQCVGVLHLSHCVLPDRELVPSVWEGLPGGEVWRGLLSHSHVLDLSFAYRSRGFLRC